MPHAPVRFSRLEQPQQCAQLQQLLREESLAGCVDLGTQVDDVRCGGHDGSLFLLTHREFAPQVQWSREEDNRLRHLRGSPARTLEEEQELTRLSPRFEEFERQGSAIQAMGIAGMTETHYALFAPYGLLFCINPALLPHKARQRVTSSGAMPLLGADGGVDGADALPADWASAWCAPVADIIALQKDRCMNESGSSPRLGDSGAQSPPPGTAAAAAAGSASSQGGSPPGASSPNSPGSGEKRRPHHQPSSSLGSGLSFAGLTSSFATALTRRAEQITLLLAPRGEREPPREEVMTAPGQPGGAAYDSLLRLAAPPRTTLIAVAGCSVHTAAEADAAFQRVAPSKAAAGGRSGSPPRCSGERVVTLVAPQLPQLGPIHFPRSGGGGDGFLAGLLDAHAELRRCHTDGTIWTTPGYAEARALPPPPAAPTAWPTALARYPGSFPQWALSSRDDTFGLVDAETGEVTDVPSG
eukprot:TRINITY_DN9553_c0_g1_i1.p1 TRINITY_DN9553_c0_g1~~TRINITY_DN9553_c0_g1_i1.p1  ORF type:complete len:470 (+),score=114.27 TRINITY_DN9553_c0_g1_i1:117-1526(+)